MTGSKENNPLRECVPYKNSEVNVSGCLLWLLLRTTTPAIPTPILFVTSCSIGILHPPPPPARYLTAGVSLKPLNVYTLEVVSRATLVMGLVCGRWIYIWRMAMSNIGSLYLFFLGRSLEMTYNPRYGLRLRLSSSSRTCAAMIWTSPGLILSLSVNSIWRRPSTASL